MKIGFLYGTESGTSELVCEDIEAELGAGFDCEVTSLSDVTPADLDPGTFYFFVTSTFGTGDLPSMATEFAEALETEKPDLSGIGFAIFGLGDMVFAETFNGGSKRLMDLLLACNARMVGDRGLYDASGMELPEDIAIPWALGILDMLKAEAA